VQVGGPSGRACRPASSAAAIAFEDVPSAGAFMVFDRTRDLFEVARHFARFFAHESCGFCTPCRVGTELVVRRLDKLATRRCRPRHDIERAVRAGPPAAQPAPTAAWAPRPATRCATPSQFRPAYEQRLQSLHFAARLRPRRRTVGRAPLTGRDDEGAHFQPSTMQPRAMRHIRLEPLDQTFACSTAKPCPSARRHHPAGRAARRPRHARTCAGTRSRTHGSCRVCTGEGRHGRTVAACTTPAVAGQLEWTATREPAAQRTALLQMLFVEGNHFCPGCEKSGHCRLQATGLCAGMTELHFEEFYPDRPVDASHPDVLLEPNRCILCQLCVRASDELDGKAVFALGGHGIATHLVVNSASGRLGDSDMALDDRRAPTSARWA
jgi:[NiFe] hydrogenase diaphorase moiety small subunit